MLRWIARYTGWLHTRWPAGTVEPLPRRDRDGAPSIPGVSISGGLTGIPLLKFALDSGAKAVAAAAAQGTDPGERAAPGEILDLAIVGAGVSGMAAAVEARKRGLRFEILEAAEPFSTLVNFPKAKPIYTYPRAMKPAGDLQVNADVKEALVEELKAQTERAKIEPKAARAEGIERNGSKLGVRLEGEGDPRARGRARGGRGREGRAGRDPSERRGVHDARPRRSARFLPEERDPDRGGDACAPVDRALALRPLLRLALQLEVRRLHVAALRGPSLVSLQPPRPPEPDRRERRGRRQAPPEPDRHDRDQRIRSRVLVHARLLDGRGGVRIPENSAPEDPLRHAPDGDADGGSGASALSPAGDHPSTARLSPDAPAGIPGRPLPGGDLR